MKLIQPLPSIDSSLKVSLDQQLLCPQPVRFVKFRYGHHAAPSGYDRICDYINAPVVRPSDAMYILGETLLRPYALMQAKRGGHYEYSRYDCTMEMAAMRDMKQHRNQIYHFVYAEKSFKLAARVADRRGHRFVGTVHHPEDQQSWLFRSHVHFQSFDHLITMDKRSIDFWRGVTGRDNVTWLPHGVDTDYFCPVSERPPGNLQIVFAGSHERDLDVLTAVIEGCVARSLPVEFVLIGRNPALSQLAQRFSCVVSRQGLSDAEYCAALQQADLLLLPLRVSTVCNVVLEAMACGCPVITTAGGIEDYLSPEFAAVVPVGQTAAMIHAIEVQAGVVPGVRLNSAAAREAAESFSWRSVAQMHLDLYASV